MLTFNLKKEWFEKIKSGKKTHEYRIFNEYWCKRMSKYTFNELIQKGTNKRMPLGDICFCLGYPKKDDKEKRLKAFMMSWHIINGKDTDLKVDDLVYDIEFELIKEAADDMEND